MIDINKTTKMRIHITSFLLLLCSSSYAQDVSTPIQMLVDKMEKINMYMSSAVGYAGMKPEQWEHYEELKKKATDEELIILTDYRNSAVKCYAFQALAERKHPKTFDILLLHLNDKETVSIVQGCIGGYQTVGEFFLEVVTPKFISLSAYKLNEYQQYKVDSLLRFDEK